MHHRYLPLLLLAGCSPIQDWDGFERKFDGVLAYARRDMLENGRFGSALPAIELEGSLWNTRVSCQLDQANREDVVMSVLERAGLPFLVDGLALHGEVSGRWNQAPLVSFLNDVLAQIEGGVAQRRGAGEPLLVLTSALRIPPKERSVKGSLNVAKTLRCRHLPALQLRDSLLGSSGSTGGVLSKATRCGIQLRTNTLFLQGPLEEIEQLLAMVQEADQPRQYVEIDMLTFAVPANDTTLNVEQLIDLLANAARITWDLNGAVQKTPGLGLSVVQQHASTQNVEILASLQRRKIYRLNEFSVRVANGESFTMKNGIAGYLLITQFQSGIPSALLKKIDTGVNFNITPLILPTGQVRLELANEISQFVGGTQLAGNKQASVDSMTMQVKDGTLICWAHRILHTSSFLQQGWAWLRRVPGLEWLIDSTQEQTTRYHGIGLLRCRIVKPQADPLRLRPGLLTPMNLPALDLPNGMPSHAPPDRSSAFF